MLLAAAVAVLVWRRTALGFVGTWFFAVLSPTLLIPVPLEVAAERRMYVPLAAVIPFVVVGGYALLCRVVKSAPKRDVRPGVRTPLLLSLAAVLVLAGAYSVVDIRRLATYTDDLRFWSDAASNQPDSPLIQLNLGGVLEAAGRRDDAIAHFERAVELKPNLFMSRFRLGESLRAVGRLPEAEQQFEAAIRLNPEMAAAHFALAQLLRRRGETERAKEQYEEVLRRYPHFPRAHFSLATLLDAAGDTALAQRHYEKAIRLHANYPEARRGLGLLLLRTGQADAAIEQFRRMPPSADACANLAVAYARANRPQEALAMAQAAATMARAQGQAAESARLEAWAKSYSSSLAQPTSPGNGPNAPKPRDAPAPPH